MHAENGEPDETGDVANVTERYVMAWGRETGPLGQARDAQRGRWRPTEHAVVLDAVDLFWREPRVEQVDIFRGDELISTLHRNEPRIRATLTELERAVCNIYEEEPA